MPCTNRNSPKVQSTIDLKISDLNNIIGYNLMDFEYDIFGIFLFAQYLF